ncbi:MAG TPA: carboxypeptidase-like regulatory domain-containing protein, partial [Vicinamibacteria bacterium]|nr:carboxypeptidase-like regulatory domain-containing protein [Vicinamibacteria bacterium]
MKRYLAVALGLVLLAAAGAFAQIRAGNIYGTVTDAQGGVLPGVTVTLSGDLGTRTTVTSPQGEFRFLALDRGRYTITLNLAGFANVVREVVVTTGENVNLDLGMGVAGVQETVEVMGETPLVDVKKRGTATTMIADELQKTPNARDPWGVLKNVPGVQLDRMNIAGNENGQQANAGGKGTVEADKMWSIDGLVVTDMTATGGSPTY